MKTWRWLPVFIGALLILGGIFLLLGNLNIIDIGALFWSILLALVGVFFVMVFLQDRRQWWGLIPGVTLLSVALLLFLEEIVPGGSVDWGGVIVPGGIGLSFLLIYAANREQWWAIIPGGVMVSISLMILLQEYLQDPAHVGVFFLGLGLTFIALTTVTTKQGKMKWPWIPGGILLVMGFMFLMFGTAESLFPYLGAVALIVFGIFLLWRATRRTQQ